MAVELKKCLCKRKCNKILKLMEKTDQFIWFNVISKMLRILKTLR